MLRDRCRQLYIYTLVRLSEVNGNVDSYSTEMNTTLKDTLSYTSFHHGRRQMKVCLSACTCMRENLFDNLFLDCEYFYMHLYVRSAPFSIKYMEFHT